MKSKKSIKAKMREGKVGDNDLMPAILYGAKRKSTPISINKKEFTKLYEEVGESTLLSIDIEDNKEKAVVLIYEVQKNPSTKEIIHADFFEPNLKEEVEAEIPLDFIGESPAVKEVDGTLVRNFYSINVKALPENLPHKIEVNVENIKTVDDVITVGDLKVGSDVEVLSENDAVVAMVSLPENVEEELEKPIEEGEAEVIGEGDKDDEGKEEVSKEEKEKETDDKEEISKEKDENNEKATS
jgi:large subunit ribosomal protein L25